MKEYIKRLTKGEFDYITPKLTGGLDEIECDVIENKISKHELTFEATAAVKAIVYSSDRRVNIINSACFGDHNKIEYTVDTRGLQPDDIITGVFTYVTGAGEAETSYKFKVVQDFVDISGKELFNMFHFTELFKDTPEKAEQLFLSPEFSQVFLHNDSNLVNIYNVFKDENNIQAAIEEFLVAINKKHPVVFELDFNKKEYNQCTEDIGEIIKITADGWGYSQLKIHTDCSFVKVDKNFISTEDFTGNRYDLNFTIMVDSLFAGNNYGRIIIETNSQFLEVLIVVHNTSNILNEDIALKRAKYELTKLYLNYRIGGLDKNQWTEDSLNEIDKARDAGVFNLMLEIAYAQMLIVKKQDEKGITVLNNIADMIKKEKEQNVILYCYYKYVKSLLLKSSQYTENTAQIISGYISNGYDSWKLLWLLFYTDKNTDKNKSIKLARIKEVFHNGCYSPVMYFEACAIFNEFPHLLRVLNEFEIQVIYFGCRYSLLNDNLAMQVCDIVERTKTPNTAYLRILKILNEKMDNDRILSVLVQQMIRNEITGKNAASIYEKSILRGLRITSLYEYYMESIELSEDIRIPKMVLLYFAYNSSMSYKLKAFLFNYVIKNKNMFPDIYESYIKQIEGFTFEQLKKNNIDDNIAKIYSAILKKELVSQDNAYNLFVALFTYKVTCFDKNAIYVIVKHKELNYEVKYPITGGVTYINIFTENAAVVFEYSDGTRKKDSIIYEIEKLFDSSELLDTVLEVSQKTIYTCIYLNETKFYKGLTDNDSLRINIKLLKSTKISEDYRNFVNTLIITYCNEVYKGDDFKEIYIEILKDNLINKTASKLIETCISNELYNEAYDLIKQYGFDKVSSEKIYILARIMILSETAEYDLLLLNICKYLFDNKKYDETVLLYLNRFFNDSTDEMYAVWKACMNFNADNMEITERLIAQMLFTQNHSGRLTEVFTYYYNKGMRNSVVEAYLSYNAYLYFVKQRKANGIVFKVIENKLMDDYKAPDVCKLALLKYYSEQQINDLNDDRKKIAQIILQEMCDNEIIFAFYRKFNGVLELPYNIMDKTIVEYRGNPNSKVSIHFILSDDKKNDKYTTQTMTSKIFGIYTKSFTLFYGDTLEYYISEKINDKVCDSERKTIMCNEINPEETKGRFDYLNDILASKKLHDGATMKKLMHGYSVLEYVSKQVFKTLD